MGMDPKTHLYVSIQHRRKGKQDTHVVASRVDLNGELWLGRWEVMHFVKVCQHLEQRFGLRRTGGVDLTEALKSGEPRQQRTAPSRRVIRSNWRADRRGVGQNDPVRLTADLLNCASKAVDLADLFGVVRSKDIEVKFAYWPSENDPVKKIKGLLVKERTAGDFLSLSHVTNGQLSYPKLERLFAQRNRDELEGDLRAEALRPDREDDEDVDVSTHRSDEAEALGDQELEEHLNDDDAGDFDRPVG